MTVDTLPERVNNKAIYWVAYYLEDYKRRNKAFSSKKNAVEFARQKRNDFRDVLKNTYVTWYSLPVNYLNH